MYDRIAIPEFPTAHDVDYEMARLQAFRRILDVVSFADRHHLSDCARVTGKPEGTELLLVCRQSSKKAVQGCIGTGKPSLLRRRGSFLERGSDGANSFGVGRAGETEGSRELGRIEEIGRFVLVEHFIDFAD
jgi:hypothetical protein